MRTLYIVISAAACIAAVSATVYFLNKKVDNGIPDKIVVPDLDPNMPGKKEK